MTRTPIGIRQNNPGNIRTAPQRWHGEIDPPDGADRRFEHFATPEDGIRALCRVLLNYQSKHNLHTVEALINRWAPPVENDTGAYADHVARLIGVNPEVRVDLRIPGRLAQFAKAIITHENGQQPYSDAQILEGVRRALLS
jgi:hypothetical protein